MTLTRSAWIRRAAAPALLLLLLAAVPGCQSGGKANLTFGEYGSLTGGQANFGISTKEGIQMALDEQNAAGGVGGVPVSVTVLDDQSKPEEAHTAVERLVNADGVFAVIGEVASSNSIAAAPVCQRAGVPMISPSSTNPKVTELGDYIFRVCFIDPFQGRVMAKYAYETLKLRNVAVLKDLKSDYSVGLTQFFSEAFEGMGGKVAVVQTYSKDDQDFRAQLTAIHAKNPDGVFVQGYYTEVGLITRQGREMGLTVPFFGGDGWESEQLTKIGGASMDGCYFSTHYSVENPDPTVQNFVKGYKEKWGHSPDALAALGYDAAKLLLSNLTQLSTQDAAGFKSLQGAPTPANREARKAAQARLRDLIASTKDFPGVTGKISLNEQRNAVKAAVVLKIDKGQFKYAGSVEP